MHALDTRRSPVPGPDDVTTLWTVRVLLAAAIARAARAGLDRRALRQLLEELTEDEEGNDA